MPAQNSENRYPVFVSLWIGFRHRNVYRRLYQGGNDSRIVPRDYSEDPLLHRVTKSYLELDERRLPRLWTLW